jgi:hypothetical protein
MDYFNIIRSEDVLKVQGYDVEELKGYLKECDYTYITEGKSRKTIVRNRGGKLEGILINSMELLMENVCTEVSSFVKGYHYVLVCPFLYHDWDMYCKK